MLSALLAAARVELCLCTVQRASSCRYSPSDVLRAEGHSRTIVGIEHRRHQEGEVSSRLPAPLWDAVAHVQTLDGGSCTPAWSAEVKLLLRFPIPSSAQLHRLQTQPAALPVVAC